MVFRSLQFQISASVNFAAANNIEMISPINAFCEMNKKGKPLYLKKDMHFNAEGHELFAKVIADYLLKSP